MPNEQRRAAAQAVLKRRAARSSLTDWCRHCGFEPALHHQLIIRELEALERGDFDRLAISCPPGSGKTSYASHAFPPWYLARNPENLVLSGSHTQEFAERKIGRKVRNLIEKNTHTLGIALDEGSRSMADWALSSGGGYRAVGVGVAVAGERADLGIVEDPFAKWEEAQSANVQESAFEWYEGDFVPRLKPNARRVIIQTRFHELDLLGRVLERDKALGFEWRHIRLPMIAEDDDPLGRAVGDRLWPEWFTEDQITEARSNAMKWLGLYQQRPSAIQGEFFKSEWLKPYTTAPVRETMRTYLAGDFAVTQDGGDFTCLLVLGMDPNGQLYLLDLWRRQSSSDIWVEALCDMIETFKPLGAAFEKGQITAGIGPYLARRQKERRAYCAIQTFPTKFDKVIRCQSIRARMAHPNGGLHVPAYAPWFPDFRAELLSFPHGKHDAQCDALGLAGQLLDRMVTGTAAPKAPVTDLAERRRLMIIERDKAWAGRYSLAAEREEKQPNWKTV